MDDPSELPRKSTATGVVGGIGQATGVWEKNWTCPFCKSKNYASRNQCRRCAMEKPAGTQEVEWNEALQNWASGKASDWKEAMDADSRQIYYYNTVTNETSWERPAAMGPAPLSTGWYGRGSGGDTLQKQYKERNAEWMKRPARKQVELDPRKIQRYEGQNEYNIWYHRFLGDHWDLTASKDPAETRCDSREDCGWTMADKDESGEKNALDETHDIFGRDRHATFRDDMSGVGSFQKNCRTLYLAGIKRWKGEDLEKVLQRHFSEWGEVEHINIVWRLMIGFVRYRCRANAEFGKVAMENQALDHDEVLNVRWAFDDPNPVAKDTAERMNRDAILAHLQARGVSLEAADFEYPQWYQLPEAIPVQLEDGTVVDQYTQQSKVGGPTEGGASAAGGGPAPVSADGLGLYPNTDAQYAAADTAAIEATASGTHGESIKDLTDSYANDGNEASGAVRAVSATTQAAGDQGMLAPGEAARLRYQEQFESFQRNAPQSTSAAAPAAPAATSQGITKPPPPPGPPPAPLLRSAQASASSVPMVHAAPGSAPAGSQTRTRYGYLAVDVPEEDSDNEPAAPIPPPPTQTDTTQPVAPTAPQQGEKVSKQSVTKVLARLQHAKQIKQTQKQVLASTKAARVEQRNVEAEAAAKAAEDKAAAQANADAEAAQRAHEIVHGAKPSSESRRSRRRSTSRSRSPGGRRSTRRSPSPRRRSRSGSRRQPSRRSRSRSSSSSSSSSSTSSSSCSSSSSSSSDERRRTTRSRGRRTRSGRRRTRE